MLMNRIAQNEVRFHPHSFADPDGRLFWWNGELYRAISHETTPFFQRLFQDGTIADLIHHGFLIESEPTSLAFEGYGMVLRHRSAAFVSYPEEWCLAMLKDAALAYLDFLKELASRGLTLRDTHPWNILFDAGRPVYVDITSIKALPVGANVPDYKKFCRYYLYPLILMSLGQERIVRYLMPDYEGIRESDFSLLSGRGTPLQSGRSLSVLQKCIPERHRRVLKDCVSYAQSLIRSNSGNSNSPVNSIDRARRQVEDIPAPEGYVEYERLNAEVERSLGRTISELTPQSILVVGAKTKWYANLAEQPHASVAVFDKDSAYVTALYYTAREKRLTLLPLLMDFTDPTPSRGLSSHIAIGAEERFRCDVVIALDLVERLMSEKRLRCDQVVDGLHRFSKRWLIVSCTQAETLSSSLAMRFRRVTKLAAGAENRILLCEKG
jgi:hypothetical protein